jgi:5-formyltetrahydrofolate cyclo-ligase
MPIARNNEINTANLLQYVWQQWPDVQTAVPVMRRGRLHSALVDSTTEWREGPLHVPEPVASKEHADHHKFDLIVVPMLGYNKRGYRIGYGGGHYDRFLASQSQALTVGLCYGENLVTFEPEVHDVPLDIIVTDQKIHRLS